MVFEARCVVNLKEGRLISYQSAHPVIYLYVHNDVTRTFLTPLRVKLTFMLSKLRRTDHSDCLLGNDALSFGLVWSRRTFPHLATSYLIQAFSVVPVATVRFG